MSLGMELVDSIAGKEHRLLVLEFFAVFSRFEFALKQADCCGHGSIKNLDSASDILGWAQADWKEFSKTIVGKFATVTNSKFVEMRNYLESHAPKQQVKMRSGSLAGASLSNKTRFLV